MANLFAIVSKNGGLGRLIFRTLKQETKRQDFWGENKTLLKVELSPSIRRVTTLVGH